MTVRYVCVDYCFDWGLFSLFRYGRETAERFGIVETGQRILESCTVWMDRVGISLNTGALLCGGADKLFWTCINKTFKERFDQRECKIAKTKDFMQKRKTIFTKNAVIH